MITEIEDGLRAASGSPTAWTRHPKVFPEFYRGIVRSAELTGELDTVLDRLATLPRTRPGGAPKDQVGDRSTR